MHPNDLAVIWERLSSGESLFDIATECGVSAARLHQELQRYLADQERERERDRLPIAAA